MTRKIILFALVICGAFFGGSLPEEAGAAPFPGGTAGPEPSEMHRFCRMGNGIPPGAAAPRAAVPPATGAENRITWAFDPNVPESARTYILGLWAAIEAPMRNVLGPPSRNMTVTVRHDPNDWWALYYPGADLMQFKALPNPGPNGDDVLFNFFFIHETGHAYTDKALDLGGWDNWVCEGLAVYTEMLMREQLRGVREIYNLRSIGKLTADYDALGQMGKEVLNGTRGGGMQGYGVASEWNAEAIGGLWWFLSASQCDVPASQWSGYDFVSRVCQQVYSSDRKLDSAGAFATIDEIATRTVDGVVAGDWARSQPAANTAGTPGMYMWAAIVNDSASDAPPLPGSFLQYQPFRRYSTGGAAYRQFNLPVVFRAWNLAGQLVWNETRTPTNLNKETASMSLPPIIKSTPGAYVVEVDGSAYAATARTVLVIQTVSLEWRGTYDIDKGCGFAFFDPAAKRLRVPSFTLEGAQQVYAADGIFLAKPDSVTNNPCAFTIHADQHAVARASSIRNVQLPLRRFMRIDLPAAPVLRATSTVFDDDMNGGSTGDDDGIPERGERIEVRVALLNDGSLESPAGTAWVEWTQPPPAKSISWSRTLVNVPAIAAGQSIQLDPFLFDVQATTVVGGVFRLMWRGASDPAVEVGVGVIRVNSYVAGISAGGSHTLAVTEDGALSTVGANLRGQLGDGTTIDRWAPIRIALPPPGPTEGVARKPIAVSGGADYSLILDSDGTVMACGSNLMGQLGDGTNTARSTPVDVTGISGVIAVAAGGGHSVALRSDGSVWAWGANWLGQLGDGGGSNRSTPGPVPGLTGIVAIATGALHTVALKSDGTVWGWGYNSEGELGDGTNEDRRTPVLMSGLSGVVAIAAGSLHTLALKSDGTVWATGYNYSGQLGDGTDQDRWTPTEVPGFSGVTSIAAGGEHSLAVKSDGTLWSWGANGAGQLGDGRVVNRTSPLKVEGLPAIRTVRGGDLHTVVVDTRGAAWLWGSNSNGQLGDGTTNGRLSPGRAAGF